MSKFLMLILISALFVPAASAQPQENEKKLNDTIERVMKEQQYQWRLPRGKFEPQQNTFLGSAFQKIEDYISAFFKTVNGWIQKIRDWLNRRSRANSSKNTGRFLGNEKMLLYALGGVLACALLYFVFKVRKRKSAEAIRVQAVVPLPDLNQENLLASELPEDEWMKMARDLVSRGELRLAMRALYMSGLAYLASREFLTIAKFKSNREYQLELQRRAHSYPQMLHSFSENVSLLERTWYGNHQVTGEIFDHFRQNQEHLKLE